MVRVRRPWWWIYALCAGLVLGALAFVSRIALRLECDAFCSAERGRQQDRVRTALWRLDSYLLPILSREGARPYFEYLAYYPQERSYTRYLSAIEKGEVLVPSPLLTFAPEHVRLHFQVDASGLFSSPQSPEGNLLDLAQATCQSSETIPHTRTTLAEVVALVPLESVRAAVARAEELEKSLSGRWLAPHPLPAVVAPEPQTRDPVEWDARQKNAYKTKQDAKKDAETQNEQLDLQTADATISAVKVGTLVPMWLGAATPELFFFRRVVVGESELLQGIFLDWGGLEAALIADVDELLPGAWLEPLREVANDWEPGAGSSLATIPAQLVVPEAPATFAAAAPSGLTATRGTLLLAWGAVVAALIGGSLILRSSLLLGERRSRFASAVTHELRTPLTTFRLYSEMLADGMVKDPEQRRVYLDTLKEQSGRLATLVENVLAYARLEDGRGVSRRERIGVAALVSRHRAALERRAQEGGMELVTSVDESLGGAALTTDADAVGQVLCNLVDNACKYARAAADRRIEWTTSRRDGRLELRVLDHGPGVPADAARRVFRPFERGPKNGDPTPGVGLGLALARGIARDLGGELALEPAAGGGASFTLRLPLDA